MQEDKFLKNREDPSINTFSASSSNTITKRKVQEWLKLLEQSIFYIRKGSALSQRTTIFPTIFERYGVKSNTEIMHVPFDESNFTKFTIHDITLDPDTCAVPSTFNFFCLSNIRSIRNSWRMLTYHFKIHQIINRTNRKPILS